MKSRPISVFARTGRWAKRNPAIAGLLATVFLTLMAGVTLAFLARGREIALRNEEVNSILSVLPKGYPAVLDELQAKSRGKALASALEAQSHIRAKVALLFFAEPPDHVAMVNTLTKAPLGGEEYLSFLAAMHTRHDGVLAGLGELASTADEDASKRFRAACGIAMYGEESSRADWDDSVFAVVAGSLIRESRGEGLVWTNSVRSIRDELRPELEEAFGEGRVPAAEVLAELFEDDVEALVGWLATATPFQLSSLVAKLQRQQHKTAAVEMLARNRSQFNPVKQPVETANLAVAQWALGEVDAVGELLEAGSDNTVRTLIIHRIPHSDPGPQRVIERLASQDELATSVRAALWLTLGEYDKYSLTGVSTEELSRIEELATSSYNATPSGGIHSAVEWLLRRSNLPIPDSQRQLTDERDPPWFTLAGHTMVAFRRPQVRGELSQGGVTFFDAKTQELPYSFAIATKEVTVGQFIEFLNSEEIPPELLRRTKPLDQLRNSDPAWPMCPVTWPLALRYCEWLTRSQLDMDPEQRLEDYPPGDVVGYRGIRLPTQFEWDCACRAGSEDERFYGPHVGREMEQTFAWYGSSPEPVGLLKPNDWGLFDMRGNAREMTLDRAGGGGRIVTLGGSYRDVKYRNDTGPRVPTAGVGFRIAITID